MEPKKQVSIKFKRSNLCRSLQIVESQMTHTANALQRTSDYRITGIRFKTINTEQMLAQTTIVDPNAS
jgi:hypothetical protein